MEASLEQHGPATNGAAIDWYRAILSNGKISEDKIKTEAGIFFIFLLKKKQRTKNNSKFTWKAFSKNKRTWKQIL